MPGESRAAAHLACVYRGLAHRVGRDFREPHSVGYSSLHLNIAEALVDDINELSEAERRALEMHAARREPEPDTSLLATIGVTIFAAVVTPLAWNIVLWLLLATTFKLLPAVLLAATPSALIVACLAFATSDRWVGIGFSASFGQFVGSCFVCLVVGMGMHSGTPSDELFRTFFAPIPLYPLVAYFGAELGRSVRARKARHARESNTQVDHIGSKLDVRAPDNPTVAVALVDRT